jgi:hypothetical protein
MYDGVPVKACLVITGHCYNAGQLTASPGVHIAYRGKVITTKSIWFTLKNNNEAQSSIFLPWYEWIMAQTSEAVPALESGETTPPLGSSTVDKFRHSDKDSVELQERIFSRKEKRV